MNWLFIHQNFPAQYAHVARHLARLAEIREGAGAPGEALEEVLGAYAHIAHERPHGSELAALVHRGERFARAQQNLSDLFRDLLAAAAKASAESSSRTITGIAGTRSELPISTASEAAPESSAVCER